VDGNQDQQKHKLGGPVTSIDEDGAAMSDAAPQGAGA
jgi:hypothetical protein